MVGEIESSGKIGVKERACRVESLKKDENFSRKSENLTIFPADR